MITKSQPPKVSDILKTRGVFRFDKEEKLAKVLSDLDSSHDAAFVFDGDEFCGVVSPTYLIKSRFNFNSKLQNCVKMPPKMSMADSLKTLAQQMLESRIYFLPVFDDKQKYTGIATINRLFGYLRKRPELLNSGHITLSNRQLITIGQEVSVSSALKLMREYRIAKLPVTNQLGSVVGIISQYDLQDFIRTPNSAGSQDRSGEKKPRRSGPVKQYMSTMSVTMDHMPKFVEAVNIMLAKKVGSIVIVDNQNKPMAIVTKKDLLKTITTLSQL